MREQWKPVKGYEGLYSVSNHGRVKSLLRTTKGRKGCDRAVEERILKPIYRQDGYVTVGLCKGGKSKHIYLHRLVAEAFIKNPLNLPAVNHKDENKENNVAKNLEFCTPAYNNRYGTGSQRRALSNTRHFKQLTIYGAEIVRIYRNAEEVSAYGYDVEAIKEVCEGKRTSYAGYIWRYTK